MTHLRQRMIEDMQLRSFAQRTQDAYLRAVHQLAEHFNKSPGDVTEENLRQYFLPGQPALAPALAERSPGDLRLSEECEASFPQHMHPSSLWDQVLFPVHAEEGMEDF